MNYLIINSTDYNYEISIHLSNGNIFMLKQSDLDFPIKDDIVNLLNELLNKYILILNNINIVGIIIGPGSYTSLRVGIALANSLGLALNIPVIGVSLFSILLESVIKQINDYKSVKGTILSVIPDYKGGFFGQFFDNKFNILTDPMILNQEILDAYKTNIIISNHIDLVKDSLNFIETTAIYAFDINTKNIKDTVEKKYYNSVLDVCKSVDVLYVKAPKITLCKN